MYVYICESIFHCEYLSSVYINLSFFKSLFCSESIQARSRTNVRIVTGASSSSPTYSSTRDCTQVQHFIRLYTGTAVHTTVHLTSAHATAHRYSSTRDCTLVEQHTLLHTGTAVHTTVHWYSSKLATHGYSTQVCTNVQQFKQLKYVQQYWWLNKGTSVHIK